MPNDNYTSLPVAALTRKKNVLIYDIAQHSRNQRGEYYSSPTTISGAVLAARFR